MASGPIPDTISLIGMPGAGKSTVGVILAKLAGLRFADTDLEIQLRAGATLQEILERDGHLHLRALEEQVLLALPLDGAIISTGGSVVYSEAIMRRLREAGPPASDLDAAGGFGQAGYLAGATGGSAWEELVDVLELKAGFLAQFAYHGRDLVLLVVGVQVVDHLPVVISHVGDPFFVLGQKAGQVLVPQGRIGDKAVLVYLDLGSFVLYKRHLGGS